MVSKRSSNESVARYRYRHTLEVGKVSLLVERSGLETERADNVVDLDSAVLEILTSLLGGSVGTNVYRQILIRTFRLIIGGSLVFKGRVENTNQQ